MVLLFVIFEITRGEALQRNDDLGFVSGSSDADGRGSEIDLAVSNLLFAVLGDHDGNVRGINDEFALIPEAIEAGLDDRFDVDLRLEGVSNGFRQVRGLVK